MDIERAICPGCGDPIDYCTGTERCRRAQAEEAGEELDPIPNCDDAGTGEGKYHGRM